MADRTRDRLFWGTVGLIVILLVVWKVGDSWRDSLQRKKAADGAAARFLAAHENCRSKAAAGQIGSYANCMAAKIDATPQADGSALVVDSYASRRGWPDGSTRIIDND